VPASKTHMRILGILTLVVVSLFTSHAQARPTCAAGDDACRKVVDVLEELRDNLHGPCGTPRVNASYRLITVGPHALPALREYFDDKNRELAGFALAAAFELGDGAVLTTWCQGKRGRFCRDLPGALVVQRGAQQAILESGGQWGRSTRVTLAPDGTGHLLVSGESTAITARHVVGSRVTLTLDGGDHVTFRLGAGGTLSWQGLTLRPLAAK
jgi:hypothetical protein